MDLLSFSSAENEVCKLKFTEVAKQKAWQLRLKCLRTFFVFPNLRKGVTEKMNAENFKMPAVSA
jgi:hypothetical protein